MTSHSVDGLVVIVEQGTTACFRHRDVELEPLYVNARAIVLSMDPASKIWSLTIVIGHSRRTIMLTGMSWQKVLEDVARAYDDVNDVRTRETVLMYMRSVEESLGERGEKRLSKEKDDRVYDLICAADKCRSEIVLCLMGAPGIGKTEAVERFARDHDRNVVHIIASQIMPNEVSGMTMPNQETHSMDVFDHYRLSHMRDGDILFMDELLKGQQQVLNACLTMIQERRLMSGTRLPDVLIIAAANPLASPKMLPLEIRQRFMFVRVDWDKDRWVDYMVTKHGFRRTKMLTEVADLVQRERNKDDGWNTLTPRTVTKIMEWIRAVGGDSRVIGSLLFDDYGLDRSNVRLIREAAIGYREDDLTRVVYKINDIIGMRGTDCDPDYEDERREAKSIIDDALRGESFDLKELIERLQILPEWEEMEAELAKTPLV